MPRLSGNNETNSQHGRLKSFFEKKQVSLKSLTSKELEIASGVITPDQISITLDDVSGHQGAKEALMDALYTLANPKLSSTGLDATPKGILLYGPPGTGKTMLAKAVAKEADITFINVPPSAIHSKWLGESEKTITAIFSLATKLKPTVIFLDEVECLVRSRSDYEHPVDSRLKAELLSLWDGIVSGQGVMLIGATNRPGDIDEAFQRRFERQIEIGPLNEQERRHLLEIILRKQKTEGDIDYDNLAACTNGFTGSNLSDMCRHALQLSQRSYIQQEITNRRKQKLSSPEKTNDVEASNSEKNDNQKIDVSENQAEEEGVMKEPRGINYDDLCTARRFMADQLSFQNQHQQQRNARSWFVNSNFNNINSRGASLVPQ